MSCYRTVIAIVALLGVTSGAGCATVPAWKRERLARPDMVQGDHPHLYAGEEHATAYREGATGATGTAAGGCGCN